MPFKVIRGEFRPASGIPDGDTLRFAPDNPAQLGDLRGPAPRLSATGEVALRLEAIDAVEKAAAPSAAHPAVDSLLELAGSGATRTASRGYILTRSTEAHGRVVAFAFAPRVAATLPDGEWVHLAAQRLRHSLNYQQVRRGLAYPLFYNTLFAELRQPFVTATLFARRNGLGYWPRDATTTGVEYRGRSSLDNIAPIWPKLWRRLDEYGRTHRGLGDFLDFVEAKRERVDLIDTADERGLEDILVVEGNRLRMTVEPWKVRVRTRVG